MWSAIEVNHERTLDTSSALAWGLIAVLRKSERAAEFLNEDKLPLWASQEQIKYAIELVIKQAKKQVSAVELYQQQRSVKRNAYVNSLPKVMPIDFQNWSKEDGCTIDKNIASIDNFFRNEGGSDYPNNNNTELNVNLRSGMFPAQLVYLFL